MSARVLLLLLAALLAVQGGELPGRSLKAEASGRGPRRCPPLPRGSGAAATQLLGQHEGSKCADFIKGVRDWKLTGLLRQVSRGRVIICPTNAALQQVFMKMGMYKRPFEIPPRAKLAFRKFVQFGVAYPRTHVLVSHGCGNLYASHKIGQTNGRMTIIKQGQGANAAEFEDTEYTYSVLGTGYNSYVGFPLSFGMSSLDPGFTLTSIFRLNPETVRSLSKTGGSCTSQFSTSTYNSANDMKESLTASLSIGGDLGVVAFEASASFSMVSSTQMTSQTITTNSGAKVYLGGYSLAHGPGGMPLEPGFVANLLPLMQAAAEDRYDGFALRSLVDNYGTHYIKTVYWGGLASVINQMTAQTYDSLSSLGVSVSIAVQAAVVQVSADVDYSKTNTESVQSASKTFSQILIPSSVPLALTSSKVLDDGGPPSASFIDCVQWTNSLREAQETKGWKAPVFYTIADLAGVMSFPQLYPSDWSAVLPAMQRQLYTYQKTCGYTAGNIVEWEEKIRTVRGYTACKPKPLLSACVVGTYKSNSGSCNTCYGAGVAVGPNCNSTYTLTCSAAACYCQPKYAQDPEVANVFCTPLARNPPAPPAPSMAQLSKKK